MSKVYVSFYKNIKTEKRQVRLKDIARVSVPDNPVLESNIRTMIVCSIPNKINQHFVIDTYQIIVQLEQYKPELRMNILENHRTVIQIEEFRKTSKFLSFVVWLVLFVGAAMTIINFHYDVSMQEVQQKIHFFITGEEKTNPLFMQIPYSIGLGVGMMLFFNRIFKYQLSDDPSPLEVEMYKFDDTVHHFLRNKENGRD